MNFNRKKENISFLGNLYNQSDYSDIELVVENERFYAHRTILAARSEYFRALLYGGLRESQHDNHCIEIKECQSAAFRILLLYIYTGRVSLLKEKVNNLKNFNDFIIKVKCSFVLGRHST